MRIAISGSHSTGKSTLITAFTARRPEYVYEPEAYEELADEIALSTSEGPDADGLAALLEYTLSALASHQPEVSVIFERSPVDYFAYAAASRSIPRLERTEFMRSHIHSVRDAIRTLDLIAFIPVSSRGPVVSRRHEDEHFRQRVDRELRRSLIDDHYSLLGDRDMPVVIELSPFPEQQLAELMRCTATGAQM